MSVPLDAGATPLRSPFGFEEIEHTADLAMSVWGRDLAELFSQAAAGMFHLLECAPAGEARWITRGFSMAAQDVEALLVDWLGELLYICEVEGVWFQCFGLASVTPTKLEATAMGLDHHMPQRGIKAVTFADLKVVRTPVGYETAIIFDV